MVALPETMRAVLLTGFGGPEMLELRDDVATPTPAVDEVVVRVGACGVNNTDINTRVGWYSRSVTGGTDGGGAGDVDDGRWGGGEAAFPRIQGADPSGVVAAVGAAADPSLLGRRVLVDPWVRDADRPDDRHLARYLGSELDGGFAEYCAVPARNVFPHESTLTDVELASFPCSWSTAEHMLQRVGLEERQRILVTGASGGVGSALVSLAKRRGANVVGVASEAKADAVRRIGADAVVDRSGADLHQRAIEANSGYFDVVADVVGGEATPGWFDALRRGGRYVTSGAIAGPIVELDLRTLYLNDLEFFGATVYEPGVFADLVGYISRGEVEPVVGDEFPLEQIAEAQSAFGRKDHVGAIVLTVADLHA